MGIRFHKKHTDMGIIIFNMKSLRSFPECTLILASCLGSSWDLAWDLALDLALALRSQAWP